MYNDLILFSRPLQGGSPHLNARLTFDGKTIHLALQASRKMRIVEVQGPSKFLEAFDASRCDSLTVRQFGDDVSVPQEMKDDIAFMNKTSFRWGCNFTLIPDVEIIVPIATAGSRLSPLKLGVISICYEYSQFLGLLRRKYGLSLGVEVSSEVGRIPAK